MPRQSFFAPRLVAILLLLALVLPASIARAQDREIEAQLWEVVDLSFQARGKHPEDPFALEFAAEFTAPSGKTITVPGVYDGGRDFLIRFSADEPGLWRYRTTSPVRSLNDKSGTITVSSEAAGLGPVIIDPDQPRRFRHASGEGHMLLAFEIDWLFALDYDNDAGIPKTERLLDTIGENGFNHVVMNVYANDVGWRKDASLLPEHNYSNREDIFPFGGSNSAPDHSTLNVEFFQKLDRAIHALNDRDMTAHLMIYVWNKKVNWPEPSSEDDNRFFDYVIKRYAGFPNIHWDISKEALSYGARNSDFFVERLQRARDLDPFGRLITVHEARLVRSNPELMDYASVQNWSPDLGAWVADFASDFSMPVVMIESGCYELTNYRVFWGRYESAETCLDRSYRAIFGGAYASHYWQSVAWNVMIDDIAALPEEDRPKLEYYRHMQMLFDGSRYSDLRPNNRRLPCGGVYVLSDGKGYHRVYVPTDGLGMGCQRLGDYPNGYRESWLNTRTGETMSKTMPGPSSKGRRENPWSEAPAIMTIEPLPAE